MPFKAQEIKDDDFSNFSFQCDQVFEEMTKSFFKQQDEIIVNYLYEKYKDTKVSDVWVLSKPDFEKFLLEMLPKWKGKDLKGANYHNIIIDEFIDNANPSEALECLEKIIDNLDDYADFEIKQEANEHLETIKATLLKAQEPKRYLKWEDLEFKEERQEIPVRMGETIYILVLRKTDGGNKIAKLLSPKRNYMGEWGDMFYEEAKQFFNDLHLERVEE